MYIRFVYFDNFHFLKYTYSELCKKVDDGYEYHFEGDCPIIGAYSYDEPCDVVILAAKVDSNGYLTLIGDEKNDRGNLYEIEPDDVFAGHLDYVTSEITE